MLLTLTKTDQHLDDFDDKKKSLFMETQVIGYSTVHVMTPWLFF